MATKDKVTPQSYLERQREALAKRAEEAKNKSGNRDKEFLPEVGTTKIRILPPLNPEDLFYHTHTYHWLKRVGEEDDNGKRRDVMLFTRKTYEVDGKKKNDPIQAFVDKLYDTKLEDNKRTAGELKTKRRFYLNILLLDETDPEKKHRLLVDNTNQGKLMRRICSIMGIPFMRDVDDEWFDKDSINIDPDKRYFDLIDPEVGHDLKIVKKKTGDDDWAISFEDTFAVDKPRALTPEEREYLPKVYDLRNLPTVKYEESYEKVNEYLETWLAENGNGNESRKPSASASRASNARASAENEHREREAQNSSSSATEDEPISEEALAASLDSDS